MAEALDEKTAPPVQSAGAKGARTRDRILDLAYDRIIEKGFTGTSIEELVEAAGITKSGFFYHFRDKNDLARALIARYLGEVDQVLDGLEARARELNDDPLHGFLVFMKLYAEAMEQMMALHKGCLVAAVTYQDRAFSPDVRQANADAIDAWRRRFRRWIEEIAAVHPPKRPVDLEAVADQLNVIADGSIIMARAVGDPGIIARQALLQREMIRMLFAG
jgi:TetR/AcrR family transcriptional repressor of nem operon